MPVTTYAQSRSIQTKQRLCNALAALLEEKPLDSIGVRDITERAGVSVGVFYRHFTDKGDLMQALRDAYIHERGELRDTYLAAENWAGRDLEGVITKLVHDTLHEYAARRGFFRALAALEWDTDDDGPPMNVLYAGVEEIIAARLPESEANRGKARFAFFLLTQVGQAALVSPGRHARYLAIGPGQLEHELIQTLLGYLRQ